MHPFLHNYQLLSAGAVEVTEAIYCRLISLQATADYAIHIKQPEKKQQKDFFAADMVLPKAFHFFNLL
jgi:hypothetical protein